jgi:hypothetical protein
MVKNELLISSVVLFLFKPLNPELNPIRHLLALVGARHIVHVRRMRVNDICLKA